jgi:glycosyltransferase involved in cell wall biosynthesis
LWGRLAAVPNLMRGCTVEEGNWVRAVVRRAVDLSEEDGPFDVLHSRLNPAVSHLAALATVKKLRLPWCAYFSDPWPHHLYPEPYRFTVGPLSRRRQERTLDKILRRAGSLVFPSDRLRDWLLAGPRSRFGAKSLVSPHLGEPAPERSGDRNGILRVRHAGFLMKERRVEPLYGGLERFLAARPEAREEIRVEFAGRYVGNVLPEVPRELAGVVYFEPSMPPDRVRHWMSEADVALLVEADMEEGIFFPSKLSDYLAGGRPILALSPRRGVTADLLASGGGLLVQPEDEAGIATALERVHDLWRSGRLSELAPRPEQVEAVSASSVVPVYERAFEQARKAVR